MNTPITDDATFIATPESEELEETMDVVDAETARRLELDRAALMEALEKFEGCFDCHECTGTAESALAAARANFP